MSAPAFSPGRPCPLSSVPAWDLESVHAKLGPLYEGKGVEDAMDA